MTENEIPEIGPQQLDTVLHFLPIFEQPDYSFGEWHREKGHMPHFAMSLEVHGLVKELYDQQIIFSFDWMNWHDQAKKYMDDPQEIENADLLTCRKLLTAHVRADRFSSGHLAEMLKTGQITAILRRLRTIRDQME